MNKIFLGCVVPVFLVGSHILFLVAIVNRWRVRIFTHIGHFFILIIFLDSRRIRHISLQSALLLDFNHFFNLTLHDHPSLAIGLFLLFDSILRRFRVGRFLVILHQLSWLQVVQFFLDKTNGFRILSSTFDRNSLLRLLSDRVLALLAFLEIFAFYDLFLLGSTSVRI